MAAVQMLATADPERNLRAAEALLGRARREGAGLAVLPELFASGYDAVPFEAAAEEPTGPVAGALARFARESGLEVVGGVPTRLPGGIRSQAVLATARGVVARYSKRHLWGAERGRLAPGGVPVVRNTAAGPAGFLVCYDLEFPEASRPYADAAVTLLVAPSAFGTSSLFDLVTRARAVETGAFVVAANLVRPDGAGAPLCGRSRVVGPDGEVLAEVASGEGVAVAEVDARACAAWRAAHPYGRDYLARGARDAAP